jgi:competence protein ComEC
MNQIGALDLRLAIPAAVGWLVAGVLIGVPDAWLPVALACGAVAGILVVFRRGYLVALVCGTCALLAVVVGAHAGVREPVVLSEAAQSSRFVSATAVIGDPTGRATIIEANGVATASPVKIFGDLGAARIGSTVTVEGTVRTTEAGDAAAYLFFATTVTTIGPPPWYLGWADGIRSSFAATAAQFGGDGADLLPGLAIGDTSAVSTELNANMKASSLTHLTAVSGANCVIPYE